ncbi:MAG: chemotaxis response regulator protein-glutamate methylesterase [Nitrospirae bacterium]|nr:MAG: chemotaxis response regulator protein-glutamate methylesterase [Nitrospirota bacterium]
MNKIRVLVVDDSALMRKMIPRMLKTDPGIEVVGTAMDGVFALSKIRDLRPDVVTLDMDMPRMDGMETLRHIVEDFGIPTIVVSSLAKKDAELTFRALNIGAFDFVAKPRDAISLHINEIDRELIEKIRAASQNPVARLRIKKVQSLNPRENKKHPAVKPADKLLVIGISTGGPNALSYLLPRLPEDFPASILIVQHMPAGFTEMFASRLNTTCGIEVKEAREGDLVLPGRALIAPGSQHLKIKRLPLGTIAVLSSAAPVNGHKPSADVLFRSAAEEYGPMVTGLIMTGMGADGAQGMSEIRENGGFTIAQDEKSCVVFGMPKAAVERGAIKQIVALEEMADHLIQRFCWKEKEYGTVRN